MLTYAIQKLRWFKGLNDKIVCAESKTFVNLFFFGEGSKENEFYEAQRRL